MDASSNAHLRDNTTALLISSTRNHTNGVENSQIKDNTTTSLTNNLRGHNNDTQIKSEQHTPELSQHPQPVVPTTEPPPRLDYEYKHIEIFSVSSKDRKYHKIDFSGSGANNPSIIPHPILEDTWIIVAQGLDKRTEEEETPYEYVCNAKFNDDGVLHCSTPATLSVASPSSPGECPNDAGRMKVSGARNSRIFQGPETPYFTYEIHAEYTCPGQDTIKHETQYIQDLRTLLYLGTKPSTADRFARSSQLRIPAATGNIAVNNWFMFWDADNQTYAHYDLAPKRVYSKINRTNSIVEDMPIQLPASDAKCELEYMPSVGRGESIEQATNSLSITTCKRFDKNCEVAASNTFIMTIFQHISHHHEMAMSEPYVILFNRKAPFATHGISKRPLWFSGRQGKTDSNEVKDPNQVEMLNVMSISWKDSKQKYHGYADDIIYVTFGIQGTMTGFIDVLAGDLLEDIRLCSSLGGRL